MTLRGGKKSTGTKIEMGGGGKAASGAFISRIVISKCVACVQDS